MFDKNDDAGSKMDIMKEFMEQMQMNDEVIKAQLNDQRLLKLAEYDATHGYLKNGVEPEVYHAKFAELKGMVKRGSFTIRDLETDVYTKWGILEESRQLSAGDSKPRNAIGFHIDDMEVAAIAEDSPDNR